MPKIAAIILTGGQSRRMGRSKADLLFGGETLLRRSVRLLAPVASPVIVAAAPTQALPWLPADVVVTRDPEAGLGPLQGFAAGLAAIPMPADLAYLTAVDAPFFLEAWLDLLIEQIGDHEAAFAVVDGLPRPISALFRVSAARTAASGLLASGIRRLTSMLTAVRSKPIPEHMLRRVDPDLRTLLNINTPDDHEHALGVLKAGTANPPNDHDFPVTRLRPNV